MCFEKFKRPGPARGLFGSGRPGPITLGPKTARPEVGPGRSRAGPRKARPELGPGRFGSARPETGPGFEKSPRADPDRPETNTKKNVMIRKNNPKSKFFRTFIVANLNILQKRVIYLSFKEILLLVGDSNKNP